MVKKIGTSGTFLKLPFILFFKSDPVSYLWLYVSIGVGFSVVLVYICMFGLLVYEVVIFRRTSLLEKGKIDILCPFLGGDFSRSIFKIFSAPFYISNYTCGWHFHCVACWMQLN